MDLLTVLVHELGHVLGWEHTETGVMAPSLAPGVREIEAGLEFEAGVSVRDRVRSRRATWTRGAVLFSRARGSGALYRGA